MVIHNSDIQTDTPLGQAKGRLADALIYLEDMVRKRIAEAEAKGVEVPRNIVSSKLVEALQEEIARLKQENEMLLQAKEKLQEKYNNLKLISENAIDSMDLAIEDLTAYRGSR